ncbi:MAG: hydrogenase maturation protease [Vicinamibacterales bacterium]
MATTLVLGIGNLLMGDEGVGVHALRAFAAEHWPDGIDLLDGGTGGFHLLEHFGAYARIVLVDATMDGQPAGTISVLRPQYASDFPRALTAHDIGLRDLIEAAVLVGPLPEMVLVTVSIEEIRSMVDELSPEVAAAVPALRAYVLAATAARAA